MADRPQTLPGLNDALKEFIAAQKMFFVATAPAEGVINLSPKGANTFRCFDDQTVAYLDLGGSGNETATHLAEDGRMTIMFCSFADEPLILRLYGRGRVVRQQDEAWPELAAFFAPLSTAGSRQIILLEIDTVRTACGHGVPVYEFKREREGGVARDE